MRRADAASTPKADADAVDASNFQSSERNPDRDVHTYTYTSNVLSPRDPLALFVCPPAPGTESDNTKRQRGTALNDLSSSSSQPSERTKQTKRRHRPRAMARRMPDVKGASWYLARWPDWSGGREGGRGRSERERGQPTSLSCFSLALPSPSDFPFLAWFARRPRLRDPEGPERLARPVDRPRAAAHGG